MTLQLKSTRKIDTPSARSEFSIAIKNPQGIQERAERCKHSIASLQQLRNQDLLIGDIENAQKLTTEIRSLQCRLLVMEAVLMVGCRADDLEVVM